MKQPREAGNAMIVPDPASASSDERMRRRSKVQAGRHRISHHRRRSIALLAVFAVLVGLVQVTSTQVAQADDYLYRPANGVFTVQGHGEGHGRGMSQYGAQGAAGIGLSATQILDFYYPGTTSTQLDPYRLLKVWISSDTDNATEVVWTAGLQVRDEATGRVLAIPAGTDRVAVVPSGSGLQVRIRIGGVWRPLDTGESGAAARVAPGVPADSTDAPADSDATTQSGEDATTQGSAPSANTSVTAPEGNPRTTGTSQTTGSATNGVPSSGATAESSASEPTADGVTPTGTTDVGTNTPTTNEATANEATANDLTTTGEPPVAPGLRTGGAALSEWAAKAAPVVTAGAVAFYYQANAQYVQLVKPDGSTVGYRGMIQGVRSGSGLVTVNHVTLDEYVRGVVPRESPASWRPAALQAQAIAARTFASVSFGSPRSPLYNICDTAACQVYGGATLNGVNINPDSTNNAVVATAGLIRTYNGSPINAQFGSTNGGITTSGGVPYLPAQVDPYEALANPPQAYANWTGQIRVSDIESRYAVGTFSRMRITQRFGAGDWGGPVISAVLEGSGGSVTITGDQLRQLVSGTTIRSPYLNITGGNPGQNPLGDLSAKKVGSTVQVSGWSFDPDSPTEALTVHVYDYLPGGGARSLGVIANQNRSDVAAVFPQAGAKHGFTAQFGIDTRGVHRVCAYGINIGPGTGNTELGCVSITVDGPFGYLDSITGFTGAVNVKGWVADFDRPGSTTEVHVYDYGPEGTRSYGKIYANRTRSDVNAVFPGVGTKHGYSADIPIYTEGVHNICVYGISVRQPGPNPLLGCQQLVVRNPFGYQDRTTTSGSQITVRGWAAEFSSPKAVVPVHVYVTGPTGTRSYAVSANVNRPDVAAVHPSIGAKHGYLTTVPAQGKGLNRVCSYAINLGPGTQNPSLGCTEVVVR